MQKEKMWVMILDMIWFQLSLFVFCLGRDARAFEVILYFLKDMLRT